MSKAREWHENGIPSEVLTQERFAAWLDTKPEGTVLGKSGHLTRCPVATYLTEVLGETLGEDEDEDDEGDAFYHILVRRDTLTVTKSRVEKNAYGDIALRKAQEMPYWMARTISRVDNGSLLFSPVKKERVVAAFEAAKGEIS